MRGQESRNRRIVPSRPAVKARTNGRLSSPDWRVLDDFDEDFPVSEEELAVIEAFLKSTLTALFDEEKTGADSKEPQSSARVRHTTVAVDDRP
jgi:hypothetical protein